MKNNNQSGRVLFRVLVYQCFGSQRSRSKLGCDLKMHHETQGISELEEMPSYNFQPNSGDTDRKSFREAKTIVDTEQHG